LYKKLILEDPFTKKFKQELLSLTYLKRNDRIIIAVSGGMDSISLLLLMHSIGFDKIKVAHVDHSIRKDSRTDRFFVEQFCKDLDIPFFLKTLDSNSRHKKDSIENWGREKRYEYFINLAKETKSDWIMTGHHGNDQAETLLLNLSRQTGVSGLTGIAKKHGKIIRPLLSFNKKSLCDFQERVGFSFMQDSTNDDIRIPRNFIRKNVLKPWENEMPYLVKGISNSIKYFYEWKVALDSIIIDFILPKLKISDKKFEIPLKLIENIPKLGKLRLMQLLFEKEKKLWSKHDLKMLDQFINKISIGKTYELPNGWLILHDRGVLIGMKKIEISKSIIDISPNKTIIFNNNKYDIIINNDRCEITDSKNEELVDWSVFKNKKLQIRLWEKGDVFQPLGMKNKKKISDFLSNEKLDSISKISQSVLTADGEIAWVCGLRISEWAKITKETNEKAILKFNPGKTL